MAKEPRWHVRWRDDEGRSRETTGFRTEDEAHRYARTVIQAGLFAPLRKAPRNVYAIQAGVDGPVKIGVTENPKARVRTMQTGHYERVYLLASCPGTLADEQRVHAALEAHRIRGEWFRPAPAVIEAVEAIRTGEVVA